MLPLSNLDSKNNSLIEVHRAFLHWGVITSSPFDEVTLINLHISSYREATGAMQMFKLSLNSWVKYFVIIKLSKFCKKDKWSHVVWPACRLLSWHVMGYWSPSKNNHPKLVIPTSSPPVLKLDTTPSNWKQKTWRCEANAQTSHST